jgi:hypothetical protein
MTIRKPFDWLDAQSQRVVNAVLFFVMRKTGWPKSFIRYAVTAVEIVALVGYAACAWTTLPPSAAWIVVAMYLPCTALSLFQQRRDRARDERHEGQGMAWNWLNPVRWAFWTFLAWDVMRLSGVAPTLGWKGDPALVYHLAVALHTTWATMSLANIYAERTPPRPPAERAAAPVLKLIPIRNAR